MQITGKNINNNNNVSNFICSNWVIALRACLAQATRCVEAWGVAKHEVKVLKTKTKWWKSQIKRGQNGAQNGVSCRKNKRWHDWWLRWTRKNKPSARNVNKTEPCKGSRSIPLSLLLSLSLSHFLLIIRSASRHIYTHFPLRRFRPYRVYDLSINRKVKQTLFVCLCVRQLKHNLDLQFSDYILNTSERAWLDRYIL